MRWLWSLLALPLLAAIPAIPAITSGRVDEEKSQTAADKTEDGGAKVAPLRELDAIRLAVEDLARLPANDQPYQRYVFIRNGDDWREACLAVNISVLRGAEPCIPAVLANGRLLRFDIQLLASETFEPGSTKDIVKTWEEFRFDRAFRETISGETTTGEIWRTTSEAQLYEDRDGKQKTPIPPDTEVEYIGVDDEWKDWRTVRVGDKKGFIKAEKLASKKVTSKTEAIQHSYHAGGTDGNGGPAGLLQRATVLPGVLDKGSEAVVVDHRYFYARGLATVDLGFGPGLYYDLRGIKKSTKNGVSDLDLLLESLGANPKESARRGTDQAAAVRVSGILGDRPRKIIVLRSDAVSPARGQSLVWITQDPNQSQSKAENNPLKNFLRFKFAASEIIFEGRSGLHGYSLNNAAGVRQNSGPDDVVADRRSPDPHPTRLHSPISCIGCHFGETGLRTFDNDLRDLLANSNADIFSEKGDIERITQLSQWTPRIDVLPIARASFQAAISRASNGLEAPKAGAGIFRTFNDFALRPVSPADACAEIQVATSDPAATIKSLLADSVDPAYFKRIDPDLESLGAGKTITRQQFDSVYAELALRRLIAAGESGIIKENGKR